MKIKELGKNKIFLVCLGVCLIFMLLFIFFLFGKEEEKVIYENDYTIYIKRDDNNLFKLDFKEKYTECDGQLCSDLLRKVTNFEVLSDLSIEDDLNKLDILKALDIIAGKIEDSNLVIETNYQFNDEDIAYIKELINENIEIKYVENFSNNKYYTVSFDTNGAEGIDSVVVEDGLKVLRPNDPTKEGYEFKGWFYNEEEYDFDSAITSDLVLVAKWAKVLDDNKDDGAEVTANKINLNSNIKATIHTKSTGSIGCFYYIFANNLKSLYPNASYQNRTGGVIGIDLCPGVRENCLDTEFVLDDFVNPEINYDVNKEKSLKNILEKYDKTAGFNLLDFSNDNHKISFSYEYISFNGLLVEDGTKAHEQVQNLLNGSYYIQGPCGGFDNLENVTVTNDVCERFNLDCGAW